MNILFDMTEVNYILNTMTDRSLIIIDELCRSTSVEAGTAIAMMICDLLARSGAYTFVTTHFTLLTKLLDSFFNIKVWQLETIPSGEPNNPKSMKLDFKFSLVPGATSLRGYGIYMVRGIWPSEVLEYVDHLQEQYTKKNKDPKLPKLDQVARLKYDSNCKLKKLKLKKKLSLANLNKHIQEFNSEMQKIGQKVDQHGQNIMEHWEMTGEASASMDMIDNSIFNASINSESVREDMSHLYLQQLTGNIAEDQVAGFEMFSPVVDQDDAEDSVTSFSEAKKRMREMFSPDTKLDISEMNNTSTYHSTDQFLKFEPEVILNCTPSQCSLNLTQEALQLELDQNKQDHSDRDEEGKHTSDPKSYFHSQLQGFDNLFKDSSNADENFVTVSQLSSQELSQKLEAIRNEKECASRVEEVAPFKLPTVSKWPHPKPQAVPESPFITTFVRPLQDDSRKTSTPLVTTSANAKNVGNSPAVSTSTLSERYGEITHVTTPKFSFTIPQGVVDLDIASMVEDLESFAEEIENEKNDAVNENSRKFTCDDNKEIANRSIYHQYGPPCKNKHIFPIVKIIPGPNNPSSEEDMNYVPNDIDTVVRSVLKIPQQKTFCDREETYSPKIVTKENNHGTGRNSTEDGTCYNSTDSEEKVVNQQNTNISITEEDYSNRERLLSNEIDSDLYRNEVRTTKEIFIGDSDAKRSLPYNRKTKTKSSTQAFKKIPKKKHYIAGENLQIGKKKLRKIKDLQKRKRKITRSKNIANKTGEISDRYLNTKIGETVDKESNIRQDDHVKEVIDNINEQNKVTNNIPSTISFEVKERPSKGKQSESGQLEDIEEGNILVEGTRNISLLNKTVPCELSNATKTENTAANAEVKASQELQIYNEEVDENAPFNHNAHTRPEQSKIAPDEADHDNKTFPNDLREELDKNDAYSHGKIDGIHKSDEENIKLQESIKETCKSSEPIRFSVTKAAKENIEKPSGHTLPEDKSDKVFTKTNINYIENKCKIETTDSVYDTALSDEEFSYSPLASIGDSHKKDEKADDGCRAELNASTLAAASPKPLSPESSSHCDQKTVNQTYMTDYERTTEKILSQSYYETLDGSKTEKFLGNHEDEKESNRNSTNQDEMSAKMKEATDNFENKAVESNKDASVPEKNTTNGDDLLGKSPKVPSLEVSSNSTASGQLYEGVTQKTTKLVENQPGDCKTDKPTKGGDPEKRKRIPTLGIRLQQSLSTVGTAKKQTTLSQAKRKRISTREINGETKKSKSPTDKYSFISNSTNLAEKMREITSISEASRLRNLEGDFTSSSSGRKDVCVEDEDMSTSNCEHEPTDSSLSEVSRRRNLDKNGNTSTTTSGKEQPNKSSRINSNEDLSDSSQAQQRRKKFKKFDAPLKNRIFRRKTSSSIDESSSLENSSSRKKDSNKSEKPKKFVYPARLSQKAIKQEFFEQDRKFYESSGSSADLAKIWEERLKRPPRPTPKQIQQTTCLATIRKTNEGVEVIPAKNKTRPHISEKKIVSSLSGGAVNMNIFSDQNAETFDKFIKSDNKDYKSFNFKFEYGEKTVDKNSGYMFDFKQVQSVASEYTQNSQSWTFVRKRSEESNLVSQASSLNFHHSLLTPTNDYSLTPEGFYKQNKEDIVSLLKKYK